MNVDRPTTDNRGTHQRVNQINGVDEKTVYEDIKLGLNTLYTRVRVYNNDTHNFYYCAICCKIFKDDARHDSKEYGSHTQHFHICDKNGSLPNGVIKQWKLFVLQKPEKWYIYMQFKLNDVIKNEYQYDNLSRTYRRTLKKRCARTEVKKITDKFTVSNVPEMFTVKYHVNVKLRRLFSKDIMSTLFEDGNEGVFDRPVNHIKTAEQSVFQAATIQCEIIQGSTVDESNHDVVLDRELHEDHDVEYETTVLGINYDGDDNVPVDDNDTDDDTDDDNNINESNELVQVKDKRNDVFLGQYNVIDVAFKCREYAQMIHQHKGIDSIVQLMNQEFASLLAKVKQQPLTKRYVLPSDDVLHEIYFSKCYSIVGSCLSKMNSSTKSIDDDNNNFIHCIIKGLYNKNPAELSLSHSSIQNCNKIFDDVNNNILKSYIEKTLCFGLTIDETEASSSISILGLYARLGLKDGNIWQHKIALCAFYNSCSGENLFKWTLSILEKKSMDIMKCTSITTDGAAAMRGEDKGLVTRLVKHIEQNRSPELALFINTDIYCFSHKENLCVVAL